MNQKDSLRIDHAVDDWAKEVLGPRIRCVAILAACSSVIFGTFVIVSVFLLIGAVIQPRAVKSGKWLMWVGALLLSGVLPSGYALICHELSGRLADRSRDDIVFWSIALCTVLVVWCDVELLIQAVTAKRRRPAGPVPPLRRSWDWVAWIAAGCFSLLTGTLVVMWFIALAARGFTPFSTDTAGAINLVAVWVEFLLAVSFDVALVLSAAKDRRR